MIPHHVVTGPEEAPALVLSHSIGSTHAMWDAQAEALAERFRLVRYDARGHGGSPTPPGAYAIEHLGGDVVELLDHLEIERAHVAGLSLGGMTAMWLAINAPERVGRLALLCTTSRHGPPEMWVERAATARDQGMEPLADGTMERWFTDRFRAQQPATVRRQRAMFAAVDNEGYANCCAVLERTNLTPDLPRITAPTLVIAAAQDPSTPPDPHARTIARGIPGARLEIFDPGSHMIAVERADEVTRLMLDHLEAA
jgi:3-oxoadipate enol-lactonase